MADNQIDSAVSDLLAPLGEGWSVTEVKTEGMQIRMVASLDAADLVTDYVATIKNDSGLQATGRGSSLGNAIADAFVVVQKQALRSMSR